MNGIVAARQILLNVTLRGDYVPDIAVEFVVDTGFVGELTLPVAAVDALGLPFLRDIPANLADNSTIFVDVHQAKIIWHGEERIVEVLAMGKHPLLGMLLLDGSAMNRQFADGGLVSLDTL